MSVGAIKTRRKFRLSLTVPVLSLAVLLGLNGCGVFQKSDRFGAIPKVFSDLNGWESENHAEALDTFKASCPILSKKSRERTVGSQLLIQASIWRSLCDDAASVPEGNAALAKQFFERRFVPYRVTNNDKEEGLFTGYYEPMLHGSLKKKGDYIYPLYLPPPELATQKPYYSHAEINRGVLDKRGLEVVWVDDPVMRFFLQIQGSGRVRLEDGRELLVGYAGQNGHAYASLGKVMGDEGLIPKDQINFFTLRQWLYTHSDRAFSLMERNPSYVFFKRLDQAGPVGSVGAVLTPQRSLAVDHRYIPYGLPLFLETELPVMASIPDHSFHRLMIAQDTGGAIRGPVRGDIFFGRGANAEYYAGYMKGRGIYTLLVPKEIADQLQPML